MTERRCSDCQFSPNDPPCSGHRLQAAAVETLAAFPVRVTRDGWTVRPFTMSESEVRFAKLRDAINGRGMETYDLVPGRYVALNHGGQVVMSTTPMELRTTRPGVREARGHVLIGGLGLGIVARAVRTLRRVTSVTVVEIEPAVVALVAPTLPAGIDVVEGDVTAWTPPDGTRYDAVWLDIWPNVPNGDDWHLMKTLRRRWRRWAPAAGSIQCWREAQARGNR